MNTRTPRTPPAPRPPITALRLRAAVRLQDALAHDHGVTVDGIEAFELIETVVAALNPDI